MTRKKVIDKIANNRVRLVPRFGNDTADEHTGAPVPFQIDHAMRLARAVNFCPAMWAPRSLVLCRHKLEFPFELRIAHDFVA